jgi:hypothetical protein
LNAGKGEGSRKSREPRKASREGLGRSGQLLHGLDADDGRDRRDLEAPPGIAEVLLDRSDIEPAGDLLRDPDGKAVARRPKCNR